MDDDNDADHFLLYLILFTHLEKNILSKTTNLNTAIIKSGSTIPGNVFKWHLLFRIKISCFTQSLVTIFS